MATEDDAKPRYRRTIETAYLSAFQLMRYAARDGAELLVWNGRDGECPTKFTFDGREYKFRTGQNERSTILPERADMVIVSYSREAWAECCRMGWEAACTRDPKYIERTPTLQAFMQVAPFEHGLARVITRHAYLHESIEWMGRLGR